MKDNTVFLNLRRIALLLLAAALFLAWTFLLNDFEKVPLVNTGGRSFEKATVEEILTDNLQENGARIGDQRVMLRMRSGPLKGHCVEAVSPNSLLFGAACEPGMRVIAISSLAGGLDVTTVYSADRSGAVYLFIGLFLLSLYLVGGKNGLKSAAGLLFTLFCIVYLLFPMIYRGVSPFLAALIICAVTTAATLGLVAGCSVKSLCAALGTLFGVLVSGISAALFGYFAGISGLNVSTVESLLFVGQATEIRVGELLFAGILISALGAVMDVAMSVASTLNELHLKNPAMSRSELFASGMNVGKDMTMILAFAGGSLGTLMLNYAYDLPYAQIVNSYQIGIEIMQGISGSIGIILTVPLVSLISSLMLGARRNSTASETCILPVICKPSKGRSMNAPAFFNQNNCKSSFGKSMTNCAPARSSSTRSRKPQLHPTGKAPEFFAVATSTSESPT